jgi:sulfate adenylyltransferase
LSYHPDAIAAHGGELINRVASSAQREVFLSKADFLPRVELDERAVSDLEMIAIGGFSPLTGFMNQADYNRVVTQMRLANGIVWSIPITLSVTEEVAAPLQAGGLVRLDNPRGEFIGVLELTQKYTYDKQQEAINVYRTDDAKHPGVQVVYNQGSINLAGDIWLLQRDSHPHFPSYQIDPAASREMFREKGWKTIVGFQTPNPIHRAHE